MTIYSDKIEDILKTSRQSIKDFKRHKAFFPALEEIKKVYPNFYVSQYEHVLFVSIYLTEEDDKTLPLLFEEIILSYSSIERDKDNSTDEDDACISFYFVLKKAVFSKGSRPIMQLKVDYSSLCERVVTGSKVINEYEYKCS